MKIINEIINLYQKGESLEKISSTLYLTPAFVNYIIQLSKTCSEKEIMDKFKHMSEYRNPDISLEELKVNLEKFVYETSFYPACNRCNRGTGKCPVIPVAEQL